MDFVFERHEPADIKKENFSIVEMHNENSWDFQSPPESIKLLNRYLIEKTNILDFINCLSKSYQTYSCVFIGDIDENFTKVEKYKIKSNMAKYGWGESKGIKELYIKKISFIDKNQMNIIENFYQNSIIMFFREHNNSFDISKIAKEIGLLDMPKDVAYFCLTKDSILNIIKHNVAVVYKLSSYYERDVTTERDIFICYSPYKL